MECLISGRGLSERRALVVPDPQHLDVAPATSSARAGARREGGSGSAPPICKNAASHLVMHADDMYSGLLLLTPSMSPEVPPISSTISSLRISRVSAGSGCLGGGGAAVRPLPHLQAARAQPGRSNNRPWHNLTGSRVLQGVDSDIKATEWIASRIGDSSTAAMCSILALEHPSDTAAPDHWGEGHYSPM